MDVYSKIATALQSVLNDQADDLAIRTGFIKRRRKITGSNFAKTLERDKVCTPSLTFHQSLNFVTTVDQLETLRAGEHALPGSWTRGAAEYRLSSRLLQYLAMIHPKRTCHAFPPRRR